jgi:hypothetical protein
MFPKLEDKQAVLTFMACQDAVAWMLELAEYVLKGL